MVEIRISITFSIELSEKSLHFEQQLQAVLQTMSINDTWASPLGSRYASAKLTNISFTMFTLLITP